MSIELLPGRTGGLAALGPTSWWAWLAVLVLLLVLGVAGLRWERRERARALAQREDWARRQRERAGPEA